MQKGTLNADRLASLRKLQRELELREVLTAELAEKQCWKNIHKSAKRFMKESPKDR